MIPVLRNKDARAWPKHAMGMLAEYLPPEQAFERAFDTDAHFQACSLPAMPRRLCKSPEAPFHPKHGLVPEIGLFVVDVDDEVAHRANKAREKLPDPKPPKMNARESWWREEQVKLEQLRAVHGGFVYRTSGGYRLVVKLAEPHKLDDDAADDRWTRLYVRALAYLLERFGIVADPACRDWTRLYRLPRVMRDEGKLEQWPTLGNPRELGSWSWPELTDAARTAARAQGVLDDGWKYALPYLDEPLERRRTPRTPRLVVAADVEAMADHARLVDLLAPIIATHTEVRGFHQIHVRLAGALLERGFPAGEIEAFVRALCSASNDGEVAKRLSDWHGTHARIADAKPVTGEKALAKDYPDVAEALRKALPNRSHARDIRAQLDTRGVPDELPATEAVERIRELYRAPPEGVTLLRVTEGTGKTRAVADEMIERAATGGAPVSLATAMHSVASGVFDRAAQAGAPVAHRRGVLSVLNDDGTPACRLHAEASALASAGQNVRTALCLGIAANADNTEDPCVHLSGCAAFKGTTRSENTTEDREAIGLVTVHELLGESASFAGDAGLHVVDEDAGLYESHTLTVDELQHALTHARSFKGRTAGALREIAVQLVAALPGAALETTLRELLEPRVTEEQRVLAAYKIPPVRVEGVPLKRRSQWAPTLHPRGRAAIRDGQGEDALKASTTFALLARAIAGAFPESQPDDSTPHGQRAQGWVRMTHEEPKPALVLVLGTDALGAACSRSGPTILADATADTDVLEKLLPHDKVNIVDVRTADGAPVKRTLLYCEGATRKSWIPKNASTRWGDGLVRYLDEAVRLADVPDGGSLGIITFKRLADELRLAWDGSQYPHDGIERILRGLRERRVTVCFGHYGALRGRDDWRDSDALVVLGTPRPNLGASQAIADALGLEQSAAYRHAISAELSQACGRLRTPWRTKAGSIVVVANVVPLSWDARATVLELPHGIGERAALVLSEGSNRERAAAAGVSERTVQRQNAEKRNDYAAKEGETHAPISTSGIQMGGRVSTPNPAESLEPVESGIQPPAMAPPTVVRGRRKVLVKQMSGRARLAFVARELGWKSTADAVAGLAPFVDGLERPDDLRAWVRAWQRGEHEVPPDVRRVLAWLSLRSVARRFRVVRRVRPTGAVLRAEELVPCGWGSAELLHAAIAEEGLEPPSLAYLRLLLERSKGEKLAA